MLLLLQQHQPDNGIGLLVQLLCIIGLIFALNWLGGVINRQQTGNAYAEAVTFVRQYHATRTEPFTSAEQYALVRTVARVFDLGEETVAQIVKENRPAHRPWQAPS